MFFDFRLLGAEQFTDVLLAAEGRTIRAHKVVLSACSSYFERLFTEFDEKNQIVIMRDTSYADISAIVEFMYKGEINVAQVNICLKVEKLGLTTEPKKINFKIGHSNTENI